MKTARIALPFTLLILCLLPGCGAIPDDPFPAEKAATVPAEAPTLGLFLVTELWQEKELLTAAAAMLRRALPLPSEETRRCLEQEASRPAVRDACLLLWSTGQEEDPVVEEDLLKTGRTSLERTLALFRRNRLIRRTGFQQLEPLLEPLRHAPVWLRARLLLSWIAQHPEAATHEREWVWTAAAFQPDSPRPADIEAAWELAERLGPPHNSAVLAHFCTRSIEPQLALRCLRALSAVAPAAGRSGMALELAARISSVHAAAWTLFERSFPERSLLLRAHR